MMKVDEKTIADIRALGERLLRTAHELRTPVCTTAKAPTVIPDLVKFNDALQQRFLDTHFRHIGDVGVSVQGAEKRSGLKLREVLDRAALPDGMTEEQALVWCRKTLAVYFPDPDMRYLIRVYPHVFMEARPWSNEQLELVMRQVPFLCFRIYVVEE